MEKPNQEQQQQQQKEALKCPRCDSSNTKFCYYNNYSLSQPRHFCKACKRYWTRGGTLRNVPVGGGCRKNKRVKRPTTTSSGANPMTTTITPLLSQSRIDATSSTHHINNNNPLFYGLASHDHNPFSRFGTSTGYDLGLGFSSGESIDYPNGNFNSNLSSYSNTTPTIASLLASSLYNNQHNKFMMNGGGVKNNEALAPLDQDLQVITDGKVPFCQNQLEQIGLSDPAVYWSSTNVNAWHDPANIGPSVTSLI